MSKDQLSYPVELGKCSPFLPAKLRHPIPIKQALQFNSSWGSCSLYGYSLIAFDQAVLLAILNLRLAHSLEGQSQTVVVECSLHEIASKIYPSRRPSSKDYLSIKDSLVALSTATIKLETKKWTVLKHLLECAWENNEDQSGKVKIKVNESIADILLNGLTKPLSFGIWHDLTNLGKLLYTFLSMHKTNLRISSAKLQAAINATSWDSRKFVFEVKKQSEVLVQVGILKSYVVEGKGRDTIFEFIYIDKLK